MLEFITAADYMLADYIYLYKPSLIFDQKDLQDSNVINDLISPDFLNQPITIFIKQVSDEEAIRKIIEKDCFNKIYGFLNGNDRSSSKKLCRDISNKLDLCLDANVLDKIALFCTKLQQSYFKFFTVYILLDKDINKTISFFYKDKVFLDLSSNTISSLRYMQSKVFYQSLQKTDNPLLGDFSSHEYAFILCDLCQLEDIGMLNNELPEIAIYPLFHYKCHSEIQE